MRRTLATALALFAFGCVLGHCTGCKSPQQGAENAAEVTYTSELLRCVDQANTLAESKACRRKVDARWGIVEVEAGAK